MGLSAGSSKKLFLQQSVSTSQDLPGHCRHLFSAKSPPIESSPYAFFVRPLFGQLRAG